MNFEIWCILSNFADSYNNPSSIFRQIIHWWYHVTMVSERSQLIDIECWLPRPVNSVIIRIKKYDEA